MKRVTVSQLRNQFHQLLQEVECDGVILEIMHEGSAVAVIKPIKNKALGEAGLDAWLTYLKSWGTLCLLSLTSGKCWPMIPWMNHEAWDKGSVT